MKDDWVWDFKLVWLVYDFGVWFVLLFYSGVFNN